MVRHSFILRYKMKVNQTGFFKNATKNIILNDKLYYALERMHNSKRAKQNNVKRIIKTALFLNQSRVHLGHTHTQGNPHKVLQNQPLQVQPMNEGGDLRSSIGASE